MVGKDEQITLPKKDIIGFLERNLHLTEGVHAGELIQFKNSPWMIHPLKAMDNDNYSKVTVLKAAGCGGTYIAEAAIAWCMTNMGARTVGYQIWTAQKAARMGTRIMQKLDTIPAFVRRVPKRDIYAKGKKEITFNWPPSKLFIQEASETAAQSDRMDWVLCDEPWMYPPGRLAEFDKRTEGVSPFYKHGRISTAPRDEGQDMATEYSEGKQFEFFLCCPKCHELFFPTITRRSMQDYGMEVIQFPKEGGRALRASKIKMVCPHCSAEFKNEQHARRALLEGADYVCANPGAPDWNYSCRFNAWVPWFVDWAQLADEYMRGTELARAGDLAQLSDFFMKREATYLGTPTADNSEIVVTGDYLLTEGINPSTLESFWHSGPWETEGDEEVMRYCGIDVQLDHFWMLVLEAKGTDIRMVWAGRVDAWEDLQLLVNFFKVDAWRTGVDISYGRGGEVHNEIALRGWYGFKGMDRDEGFPWQWEDEDEDGEPISGQDFLPYSQVESLQIPTRERMSPDAERYVNCISFSRKRIHDHLWELTRGRTETYFGLPDNIEKLNEAIPKKSQWVLEQMDALRFYDVVQTDARKVRLKPRKLWAKKTQSSQDHLADAYAMALTLMHVDGVFG